MTKFHTATDCWRFAKSKALDKRASDYWNKVIGIFDNVATLNNVSVSASAYSTIESHLQSLSKKPLDLPDWWKRKSDKAKKKYLEAHPRSKFAKELAASDPEAKKIVDAANKRNGSGTNATAPSGKKKKPSRKTKNSGGSGSNPPASTDGGNSPVPPTPNEEGSPNEPRDTEAHPSNKKYKSILHKWYAKGKQKMRITLARNKKGAAATWKFLKGEDLSPAQKERAKTFAATAAKLLVFGAMMTPLAGIAPQLGEHFLNMVQGGSSESAGTEKDDSIKAVDLHMDLDNIDEGMFLDKMHEWLQGQDIPALVEKLKGEIEL